MVKLKKDWKSSVRKKTWQKTIQVQINNSIKIINRKKTFARK
jgi:hypothetical protein